ncbi:hypothetical protein OEZ85_004358 [Tetradesmus obliquus]|uniref:Tetratricopeptide repeat-like domain-containing protein n=1 Tax=Tetradesmus obliquus TaxID=3088 RepID=A0ABY8UKW6_TETOB|nr:hypothetical protein OEZ85_004358 [Tetradesmus obliquus]
MLCYSPGLLSPRQQLLRPGAASVPGIRTRSPCLIVHAAKGFGSSKRSTKENVSTAGRKAKRVAVRPQAPQVPSGLADVAVQQYEELEAAKKAAEEEAEFASRLELIKAEAAQKKAAGLVPSLPAKAAAQQPQRAVFDAPKEPEDIYANPPSILSTLQDQLQSDINDPALREAKIGPGQLGLAGGAILFGLVFVLVAGGDFATTNRYKGVRPSRPPPDPIEMARLARQAEGFEAKFVADPADLQSLEAAAVTYARMADYPRAADLLEQLTVAKPDDAEAWRVLGEARLLNVDAKESVAAYEKALALRPNDQTIIAGLVDAYVANSQQAKAVSYLTGLRDQILANAVPAAAAGSSSSSEAAAAADAASSSAGAAGEQASSSEQQLEVDPIGVQLLLGKAYAGWRGHDQDALAAYDTLVGAFPSDFRGYLAKAVFLKERGRQGDAERMFLQAKYYAPEEMQGFVAARAGERAMIEPLPDNGME